MFHGTDLERGMEATKVGFIDSHKFVFNKQMPNEKQVSLQTDFYDNAGQAFTIQRFIVRSGCSSVYANLVGTELTPRLLRQLANELEQFGKNLSNTEMVWSSHGKIDTHDC